MPQRTNSFQRLIFAIEKALAGDGATVVESHMLPDRTTGKEREVDILITRRIGQHELRISVECRDHARKQGIEWIEQLIAKRANLTLDRVVAVSRAGFTKPAVTMAKHDGIETLALTDAINADWQSAFDGLTHVTVSEIRAAVTRIEVEAADEPPNAEHHIDSDFTVTPLFDHSGQSFGTLQDAANEALFQPIIRERISQTEQPDEHLHVRATLRYEGGATLTDMAGALVNFASLTFNAEMWRTEIRVPFQHRDYGTARVAFANVNVGLQRQALAFIQQPEQDTQIVLVNLPDPP